MSKKVAIVIPTKNKSEFLIELLRYYVDAKSPHKIYIGDASDPHHIEKLIPVINSVKNNINVVHKQYPEFCRGIMDNGITVKKLLEIVEEEYVVWSGDDDYYIPRSLDKCVDFLERNQDYSSVHGFGTFLLYDEDKRTSIIRGRYDINDYKADTATERLEMLMNNYSVLLFSVHRKEILMKAYRSMELVNDVMFCELMPVSMSAILGNSKSMNELYLIRGVHGKRNVQPKFIEYLLDPEWFHSLQVYLNTLSEEITKVDGISYNDARRIVEQAFSVYLEGYIRNAYWKRDISSSIKDIIGLVLQGVKTNVLLFTKNLVRNNILSFNRNQKPYDALIKTPGQLSKSSPDYQNCVSLLSVFNKIHD